MYDDIIRSVLREDWHLRPAEVSPLPTGWMSRAWAVQAGGGAYVVRLVDHSARQPLEAGLAAAAHLRGRGFAIGEPIRTLGGALTAKTPFGAVGLVRRVAGSMLDGHDPVDQQWWGDRLGAAHRALEGFRHPGLQRWHWLHPDAAHLAVEPWLRPAIVEAVAAMTRLTVADRLTYGVLHGDPAAEAFVVDGRSGSCGLLDWGACATGPLVYDLACAVGYAGGAERAAELIDGYIAARAVDREEVESALPVLVRFRWAVQADWYARRLAIGAETRDTPRPEPYSPDNPAADRAGLHAARDALAEIGGP